MSQPISPSPAPILDGTGHIAVDLNCFNCGYNLRTQPVTGRCPECGHPVAETTAGYLPQLDGEGRVAIDLPCVKCGYNLRTLPATGLCPECAAPVAPSTRGHYLHLAPPRWVRRLASGALLLVIAIGITFVLPIAGILFAIIASVGVRRSSGFAGGLVLILVIVTGVVFLWLLVRGVVDLTAPDPAGRFRPEGFTARKLTRYCLLLLPLLVLAGITLPALRPWTPLFWFPPGLVLVGVLSLVLSFVLPLALLRHVAALMRRIPRPGLVIYAKIEFWAILVSGILYVGSYAVMLIAAFRAFPVMAGGPNMPVPPYAAGPNAPSGAVTTSAPTSLGYTGTSTYSYTVTSVGPGGATTTTTTMPTSAPLVMTPPTFGPLFFLAGISTVVGGCSSLGTFIAGIVLLILVWRALANAARLAEVHAAPE